MLSKTSNLENRILQDIALGRYQPGELIPSRNRLAARYDCSRTTVERAIATLTASGFLTSRKGSGTFVASATPGRKITRLRVVSESGGSDNSRTQPEVMFLEEALKLPVGWVDGSSVALHADELAAPGNAVIWTMPGEEKIAVIDYLAAKQVPQLLLNREYRNYDCVFSDPVSSIREGLAWLMIESGREIAFISQTPATHRPYLHRRIIAFYELCVELGAHLSSRYIFSQEFRDIPVEIADIGERLFGGGEYPRGIFVMNQELALPLVTCAQGYGLKAGKDYFLLMFDAVPELADYPGIGMMRQPYRLFYPEVQRWVRDGFALDPHRPFHSALKAELLVKR